MSIKITLSVTFLLFTFCQSEIDEKTSIKDSIINSSHLDGLYEEINVSGKTLGIIHIYSEYPDYTWIGDDDEGIACVDDAARALIFYLNHNQDNNDIESLNKAKYLIEFLIFMQSENGLFYNFIFDDYSVNKTHKNSVNQPNWWSWRAMWALSESIAVFKSIDINLTKRITGSLSSVIIAFKDQQSVSKKTIYVKGIELPTWLPQKYSSDQAALIILGLTNFYNNTTDSSVLPYLNDLCDGILIMQKGDSLNLPFNAFLSWQNLWHAYGNSQSYALLKASSVLKREDFLLAAISEINYFYKFLMNENYLSSFYIDKKNDEYIPIETKQYSQIAYNFRVMVYACMEAYNITKDSSYASMAGEIASWFLGNNIAESQMYFPSSGICYDGINSQNTINKNSGAESTIEALLTLLAIEKNSVSKKVLNKYLVQDTN